MWKYVWHVLKPVFAQLFLQQSCRKGLRKLFLLPILKGVVCFFFFFPHCIFK